MHCWNSLIKLPSLQAACHRNASSLISVGIAIIWGCKKSVPKVRKTTMSMRGTRLRKFRLLQRCTNAVDKFPDHQKISRVCRSACSALSRSRCGGEKQLQRDGWNAETLWPRAFFFFVEKKAGSGPVRLGALSPCEFSDLGTFRGSTCSFRNVMAGFGPGFWRTKLPVLLK